MDVTDSRPIRFHDGSPDQAAYYHGEVDVTDSGPCRRCAKPYSSGSHAKGAVLAGHQHWFEAEQPPQSPTADMPLYRWEPVEGDCRRHEGPHEGFRCNGARGRFVEARPTPVEPEAPTSCEWCGAPITLDDGVWTDVKFGSGEYCPEGIEVGPDGMSPHKPRRLAVEPEVRPVHRVEWAVVSDDGTTYEVEGRTREKAEYEAALLREPDEDGYSEPGAHVVRRKVCEWVKDLSPEPRLAVEPDGLPLDVPRLARAMRDHCHDSADEGLPLLVRHKHLDPFIRDDCAAAIAREFARLGPSEDKP